MTATAARATCASFSHCVRAAESRKSPQNSDFYGHRTTYSEKAHCIKDSVLLDPACGSGSLLLKAEKILGKDAVTTGFYGQEINITTYNLCRINMFLCSGPVETAAKGPAETANLSSKEKAITKTFQTPYTG